MSAPNLGQAQSSTPSPEPRKESQAVSAPELSRLVSVRDVELFEMFGSDYNYHY